MWPQRPSRFRAVACVPLWLTLLGAPAGGTAAAGRAASAAALARRAKASSVAASRRSPSFDDLSAPLWLSSPLGAGDVVRAPGDAETTDEEVLLRREMPTIQPARRPQLGLVGQRADLRASPGPLPVMFGLGPPRKEWQRARAKPPRPGRGPKTPVDEFDVIPEGQQLSQTGEELHDMPAATARRPWPAPAERTTREERLRIKTGDVEKAPLAESRRPQHHLGPRPADAAGHQRPAAVVARRFPAHAASLAEVKMRAQCLRFARWAKARGAQGARLADLWRGTCAPAVAAGAASTRYAAMCRELDSAAAGFSSRPD